MTAPADAGKPGGPAAGALPEGALRRFTAGRRQAPAIPARPAGAPVPVTPIQQRLWLLEQTGQGGATYLTWVVHRLRGRLDPAALAEAMWHLVERHEALRVGFEERDGQVWQVVTDAKDLDLDRMWEFVDLTGGPEPDREQHARDRIDEFLTRGYDLTTPPLVRATLVRLAADEHVLAITLHHIICDGTASGVLGQELFARYRDLVEQTHSSPATPAPNPSAVSFLDYSAWLAERGSSEVDRDYWRTHLEGAPALLRLPTDRPAPLSPTRSGERYSLPLDRQLSDGLREVARRERCTLFSVLLAAYSATLVRFGAEEDLVIGAPADTRERPELAGTVGMFANTVALRTDLRGNPRLDEVVRRAARSATGGLDHATYPFDAVVELLQVPRDRRHNPLVQAMLVVGAGDSVAPDLPAGLSRDNWPLPATPARFDLTLVVSEGERLELHFDYPSEMFDASTIARIGAGVRAMMRAFTTTPQRRLWEVPVATDAQASLVAGAASGEATHHPAPSVAETELATGAGTDGAVVERILHHARHTPTATALVDDEASVSYDELVRRAYGLSLRLLAAGSGPGDTVGVVLPSGPDAIVAILAVLRIGAAYLPLDPAHPDERIADLLDEAGVTVAVAADGVDLPGRTAVAGTRGAAGSEEHTFAQALAADWHRPSGVEPAYTIFTSGSTGRPKGVVVTHGTLARFTDSFIHAHGFHSATRLLMLPPVTFDASVGDIFPALASGGALVFHPEPARLDGAELVRFCDQKNVTVVDAPVALWRSWVEELAERPPSSQWPVRMMMVGGDRVPVADLRAWVAATGGRVSLVNHYGPTEATVCATTCDPPLERFAAAAATAAADADAGGTDYLPIGRPLPHVRVYLLDRYGNPVPAGVAGEVYLGGDCLARGYLGRPGLTAQRFLPDPYAVTPGARMYRTGDLARLRTDGELEFLGRVDRQLKINGYRVEPAEVEAVLSAHPWVEDAAVVARRLAGRTALVAYVAGSGDAPTDLRGFLRQRLPDYLVPASYVAMSRLPRTSHGKLNEAALPPPSTATDAPPPEGPVETAIAAIWQRVLGAERVGRTDNFFDLGGHSLLAAGVLAQVRRDLGVELPLRALFETADLTELAGLVVERSEDADRSDGASAEDDVDLLREARVPAEFAAVRPARSLSRVPRAVLVTGSTGFLGAHLVRELLTRTDATVWCLARADDAAGAAARVIGALRRQGFEPDLGRIVGVPGDLTAPGLGRSEAELAELAKEVDVICHNGGIVNFAEPYHRLRPANVDGTREVLRLALLAGPDPVPIHFVSTLGVFLTGSYLSRTVPEDLAPDDPRGLHDGYNQSKWVADAMLRQARERGVPVSVHRPARVGGHSTTGHSNPDDYFCRLLATCVQVGMVPDLPFREDLSPVDYVAAGIAHLATTPGVDLADHHYFNREMISYPQIAAALTEHGCPVRLVEWSRWRRAVLDGLAAGEPLALAPFVVSLPEQTPDFPRPEFDCSVTEGRLRAAGIGCPPADPELLGRQLRFLAHIGRLGAPDTESRGATG